MNAAAPLLRVALAALALAWAGTASQAAVPTRYFVDVPGGGIPVAIGAFSSDARADVATFSYGSTADARPARGKFSIRMDGAPFSAGQTLPTLIVLAQTPEKLVTITFTGVTIDAAEPTGAKNERIAFEATNYSVKYGGAKPAGGQTAP